MIVNGNIRFIYKLRNVGRKITKVNFKWYNEKQTFTNNLCQKRKITYFPT